MAGGPVVIEAAISGAKQRNPNSPSTPAEISADALACFDAGAAIVHNHIDRMGVPTSEAADRYLEGWRPVLEQRPDALVYPTVNAGAPPPGEDLSGVGPAYAHLDPLAATGVLRMSLCDPGSVNLARVGADGLPSGGMVYRNSVDDFAAVLDQAIRLELGPSIAIYEPGWLRHILMWQRAGRLPAGSMVKLYLCADEGFTGAPFGLPPTEAGLAAYVDLLDGSGIPWAVSVVGGDVVATGMADLALEAGGHIHTGLEPYRSSRTPTNAQLVNEAVEVVRRHGRTVASPDETAELIGLPRRRAA